MQPVAQGAVEQTEAAGVVVLAGRSGEAVVAVGAADDTVLERIDPDSLLLEKPLLEGVAHERQGARGHRRQVELLEIAELVGGAHSGQALGAALVLEDLHQRLQGPAPRRIGGGQRRAVGVLGQKGLPLTEVRVVRNGQDVAAVTGVQTLAAEAVP